MPFSGSYDPEDVTFLLKPAEIRMTSVADKEELIQSGKRHYSEMLSPEEAPGPEYMAFYEKALRRNAGRLRADIEALADRILEITGKTVTIASLARAGTPIGVLLRRELVRRGVDVAHYSISIIRDRGIDKTALAHIARERGTHDTVFVDGWTGKGAIAGELERSLAGTPFRPILAVVADPAGCATTAATVDDYVIPSGILNGIVSGLVSRSVLNDEVVGPGDFHACLHQTHLAPHDRSRAFIEAIERAEKSSHHPNWTPKAANAARKASLETVERLGEEHKVFDRNRIKPGIAEATRAILRRMPDAIHLRDPGDPDTRHIVHLAAEMSLPILPLPQASPYRAATIIKRVSE